MDGIVYRILYRHANSQGHRGLARAPGGDVYSRSRTRSRSDSRSIASDWVWSLVVYRIYGEDVRLEGSSRQKQGLLFLFGAVLSRMAWSSTVSKPFAFCTGQAGHQTAATRTLRLVVALRVNLAGRLCLRARHWFLFSNACKVVWVTIIWNSLVHIFFTNP